MLYFSQKANGVFDSNGIMILPCFSEECPCWDGFRLSHESVFVTDGRVLHSLTEVFKEAQRVIDENKPQEPRKPITDKVVPFNNVKRKK